jgi:hypothetical protein
VGLVGNVECSVNNCLEMFAATQNSLKKPGMLSTVERSCDSTTAATTPNRSIKYYFETK